MKNLIKVFVFAFIITALFASTASTTLSAPTEKVRVMVQFEPGTKGQVERALKGAGAEFHYAFDNLNTFAVTLPQAALAGIEHNPNVVLVEEDAPRYLDWSGMPSVMNLPVESLVPQEIPYGIDMVQARDVWDTDRDGVIDDGAPTGDNRMVCIIDSGFYVDHEDLPAANVVGGYPSGWNTDMCGHGSHVAGTIAAMNNELGVVGVTPGTVDLYIVKVFGDDCSWTYSSTLVDASNRCAAAGADVISMSLGGTKKSRTEETAFNNHYANGILSVAAASNDGTTALSYPASYTSVVSVAAIDENMEWADFSNYNSAVEVAAPGVGVLSTVPYVSTNTLTVDGVTYQGQQIEFAAYGEATGALADGGLCTTTGDWSGKVVLCQRGDISFYDKVMNAENSGAVAAVIYNNEPGSFLGTLGEGYSSDIPAISLSQEDGLFLVSNKIGYVGDVVSTAPVPGSSYEAWDGTSMATPHVSGVAALVWSADTAWTNVEIRDALGATALDLGATGRDVYYGYGLVQAADALVYLGGGTPPPPPPPPPPGDLTATIDTDKDIYSNRETVRITVKVTLDSAEVSGASVAVKITTASGKAIALSGVTDSTGTAVLSWKINTRAYGTGEYTVDATVSYESYTPATASTTFTVQ